MNSAELLIDAFGRIGEVVHRAVDGLSPEELVFQPDSQSNTIAWLVWHLTRVQDDHVAAAAGMNQVWESQGWADRFALPLARSATGYRHGPREVASVVASGEMLLGYHDAVHKQTAGFVGQLKNADLDRIVDESWNPPVTLGVRLISVISDDLQHAGQAGYLRGLVRRRADRN